MLYLRHWEWSKIVYLIMEENLMTNYDVNNKKIETILSWINEGIIAIFEIQRPFVWDSTKVRDLIVLLGSPNTTREILY